MVDFNQEHVLSNLQSSRPQRYSKPLHVQLVTRSAGFNLLRYIDLSKANKPWDQEKYG